MSLKLTDLRALQDSPPEVAWKAILDEAWAVCSPTADAASFEAEVIRRDRQVGYLDHFLSTAGWDLWKAYDQAITKNSSELIQWWKRQKPGRAILILDGLSLREVPLILDGAKAHGFSILHSGVHGAELPADTTPFARSLGFSQRSSLANNEAGKSHSFEGARTEVSDVNWADCAQLIGSELDWFFWHEWPDQRLHHYDSPGTGLASLTRENASHLGSDDFWKFIKTLATGRRLIITSDHGYAASGLFPDSNKQQTEYLKKRFKSGRWSKSREQTGRWLPPLDLELASNAGGNQYVLGRRKWKSAGGYPTLTHGGLSVLEIATPFIELEKKAD